MRLSSSSKVTQPVISDRAGFQLRSQSRYPSKCRLFSFVTLLAEKKKLFSYCFLLTKSCLTLCNPMGYILPGSSVHGIYVKSYAKSEGLDSPLLAMKTEERSHELRSAGSLYKQEKAGKWILPSSLQKGAQNCTYLDFSLMRLTPDFWPISQ